MCDHYIVTKHLSYSYLRPDEAIVANCTDQIQRIKVTSFCITWLPWLLMIRIFSH